MFERFTQDARNIIVIAQREARDLSHGYVGSEHLLLALALDLGPAGTTLRGQEITHEAVRDEIVKIIGRGNTTPTGFSPFTPRARDLLRQADEVSRHLGHGYVGAEHLALAVLGSHDSVACQALKKLDVSLPELGRAVAGGFEGAYTAGLLFHGFTAAEKGGRCDLKPLRTTAEAAHEDATGDEVVHEIRIALRAAEYFVCLDAEPADTRRYLDYRHARSAANLSGGRIHVAVPKVKEITALTAVGSEVVIAETIEWEHIPLHDRLEVLSPVVEAAD